jgi:hypothetical protein
MSSITFNSKYSQTCLSQTQIYDVFLDNSIKEYDPFIAMIVKPV